MKPLLLPLLAVLAILIALAIIPAFIPLEVTNVECTNDSKYCIDDVRE